MVGYFVCFGRTNYPRRIASERIAPDKLPQTNRHRPVTLGLDEARKRITSHRITQTESPRPNYPVRITSHEDPNEYPDERQNENIGTIRRSHQRERTGSACFVFSTQTNTGVRELRESKRPNGTNGWVPSQTIKGGLAERLRIRCRAYTNDCFGFLRRLRELLEAKRHYSPAVERRDRFSLLKIRTFWANVVFERKWNRTKPNQFKVVVRTKTKTPIRVRISAEARWLAFPLGFVRIPE